jgi:hypothetical protein
MDTIADEVEEPSTPPRRQSLARIITTPNMFSDAPPIGRIVAEEEIEIPLQRVASPPVSSSVSPPLSPLTPIPDTPFPAQRYNDLPSSPDSIISAATEVRRAMIVFDVYSDSDE